MLWKPSGGNSCLITALTQSFLKTSVTKHPNILKNIWPQLYQSFGQYAESRGHCSLAFLSHALRSHQLSGLYFHHSEQLQSAVSWVAKALHQGLDGLEHSWYLSLFKDGRIHPKDQLPLPVLSVPVHPHPHLQLHHQVDDEQHAVWAGQCSIT